MLLHFTSANRTALLLYFKFWFELCHAVQYVIIGIAAFYYCHRSDFTFSLVCKNFITLYKLMGKSASNYQND